MIQLNIKVNSGTWLSCTKVYIIIGEAVNHNIGFSQSHLFLVIFPYYEILCPDSLIFGPKSAVSEDASNFNL